VSQYYLQLATLLRCVAQPPPLGRLVHDAPSPMQAIQAAKVTAAEALGRSRDVGAIAVGRFGDLIAVAGDALADVGILQSVSFVMKGGVVIKQSGQAPAL